MVSMHICMYVYMVSMHICMYVYMVSMHICMYVYMVSVHICMYIYMVSVHICMYVYMVSVYPHTQWPQTDALAPPSPRPTYSFCIPRRAKDFLHVFAVHIS